MAYILQWKNPAVDPGKTNILVPAGSTVANASSLIFTGKGAANYGKVQQENVMRLLENFADGTAPLFPTVGQTWFDTLTSTLRVYTDSTPPTWKSLGGVQVLDTVDGPPPNPQVGELWFERTGPLSGYLYAYTGIGRFPYSLTTNGGWSQIWPRVDATGLREEYDFVVSQLDAMVGFNNLAGRLFTQVPNMALLDADLLTKIVATPDTEVSLAPPPAQPRAQPVSYDWDALLSMARWVVSRLDVPLDTWQDVSGFPFVQDGRQVRRYLLETLSWFDPRYAPINRYTSNSVGTITLHRRYTETVNVLQAVGPFRWTLRGMAGASGTNSTFAPDVVTYQHARRQGAWTGGSVVTANTLFNWNNSVDRNRFLAGGNALEVTVRLIGGASPNDVALNSFLNTAGRIRLTNDMTRWFDASSVPVMTTAPDMVGMDQIVNTAGIVALGSRSGGGYSITLSGERTSNGLNLTTSVNGPAGITGQLQVTYSVIHDCTTFDTVETEVWPRPLGYNSGTDSAGTSAVLVNVILTAPPVANFTANGNTGPNQFQVTTSTPVNFVFTGLGSPTLIEWDFDGDGSFTATGPTASFTYTASGIYSPRVRVSNAGGADVLFRPGMIRVV